jgi:hypothetical protein
MSRRVAGIAGTEGSHFQDSEVARSKLHQGVQTVLRFVVPRLVWFLIFPLTGCGGSSSNTSPLPTPDFVVCVSPSSVTSEVADCPSMIAGTDETPI